MPDVKSIHVYGEQVWPEPRWTGEGVTFSYDRCCCHGESMYVCTLVTGLNRMAESMRRFARAGLTMNELAKAIKALRHPPWYVRLYRVFMGAPGERWC